MEATITGSTKPSSHSVAPLMRRRSLRRRITNGGSAPVNRLIDAPGARYERWTFGDVNTSGDVISIYKSAVATRMWACSHARGAKANIVADSFACGEGTVTNQPTTIVNHILAKIPNS